MKIIFPFLKLIQNNNLPEVLMFTGEKGIGKNYLR